MPVWDSHGGSDTCRSYHCLNAVREISDLKIIILSLSGLTGGIRFLLGKENKIIFWYHAEEKSPRLRLSGKSNFHRLDCKDVDSSF